MDKLSDSETQPSDHLNGDASVGILSRKVELDELFRAQTIGAMALIRVRWIEAGEKSSI